MTETPESFQDLIIRAQSGDKDAFAHIYETHLTPLYRYIYVRLGNREEAEDIAQETFLKAYQALDRFEVTRDNFLPYLFTVARNLLINRSKKKRPDIMPAFELDREPGVEKTSTFAEQRELIETLRGALDTLSDTEREIIELRFFAERTYAEIAITCDKREDAVRQHVARGLKKMRIVMAQFE